MLNRAISLFALFALMWPIGTVTNGAVAQGSLPPTVGHNAFYRNDVIGVSLQKGFPQAQVVEDQYLSDAFGFTVVDSEGGMLLRVAWRYRETPTQMEGRVRELVQGSPDLDLRPQPVRIGPYSGIMVADVPGMEPSVYFYLVAYGRLYEIICTERVGDVHACETLLQGISFSLLAGSPEGLGLKRTEDALNEIPPELPVPPPKGSAGSGAPDGETFQFTPPSGLEPMAAPGCADWPVSKFLQTPWASTANGDSGWPQGWSRAGPSYYGEGLHKYCNRTNGLNDHHALDFRLKEWDIVYPPAPGRVLYASWAGGGWAGLGRIVIIDLGEGYWSMSAHLRSINVSVGQDVGISTVIGYAGGSGYYQDGYWPTHLHQGLYLNAYLYTPSGGIYGGQSVEPHHVRYFGNGGGYYESISQYQWMSW